MWIEEQANAYKILLPVDNSRFTFGLLLASTVQLGSAQTSTNVAGTIDSYPIWTKANSPFNLTGDIVVSNEAILYIDPGVTVNLNGYKIIVRGSLDANGTFTDQIYFTGGDLDTGISIGGSGFISHCVITGQIMVGGSSTIQHNVVTGRIDVVNGTHVICNNTVYAAGTADGIDFFDYANGAAVICDNVVTGAWRGIAVPVGSTAIIERNYIYNNSWGIVTGTSSNSLTAGADCTILNNTLENNVGGITVIGSFPPTIGFNNFLNNSEYALTLAGAKVDGNQSNVWCTVNINAIYNWWGTNDPEAINQSIRDSNYNSPSGTVNYVPFLTMPNDQSMPNPSIRPPPVPQPSPTPTPSTPPNPSPSPTPQLRNASVLQMMCQGTTSSSNLKVDIGGSLTSNGAGIPGVPVLLSYSVTNGASWIDLTTVNTDGEGNFVALWNPLVTGNFLIKAIWAGNEAYTDAGTVVNLARDALQG